MKNFAVLFDLNGTLVDTENAFFHAYKDVLSKYGIPFTLETFTSHWSTKGKKLKDFLIEIKREDLLPKEKELLSQKDEVFQATLEERALLMPGAKETVERLKKENIKLGLDSSSTRENIEKILSIFQMSSIFDAITSGDMELDETKYGEKKRKSSRLKALADMLGISYERCVVIGDAEKDIKGAKDAGMKAIAVPNQYTKVNDFSKADKVVENLDQITSKLLEFLFT
ncbi:HAD family phosphatase [Candidatus Gottesmanbacteria bacterium]|nr:HAD family phosphatase [Candidatus Gottesmanbacteria bacterium]